jgi:hypothetical protein
VIGSRANCEEGREVLEKIYQVQFNLLVMAVDSELKIDLPYFSWLSVNLEDGL